MSKNELQRSLDLISSSLLSAELALKFWDEVADFITDNKSDKYLSSVLGYNQGFYYRAIIIELCKIYDLNKSAIGINSIIKKLNTNQFDNKQQKLFDRIQDIRKDVRPEIKQMHTARSKFIAHNDLIRLRNSENKLISIAQLEDILNKTKEIYEILFFLVTGNGISFADLTTDPHIQCFKEILKKSIQ